MSTTGTCESCGKANATLKCNPCKEKAGKLFWYCSRDCQRNHWKTHKAVCMHLKTVKEKESSQAKETSALYSTGSSIPIFQIINEVQSMSVREIKQELAEAKIDTSGLVQKIELIKELVDHRCKSLKSMKTQAEIRMEQKAARKFGKIAAEKFITCQNCSKSQDLDSPFFVCSACQKVHYCSKVCQKKHWKTHKPVCKSNKETFARIIDMHGSHDKQLNDFLEVWKQKTMAICAMIACDVMSRYQFQMQPPDFITMFEVQFNYNTQTFQILKKPAIVPISLLKDLVKDAAKESVDGTIHSAKSIPEYVVHYFLIHCKDLPSAASLRPCRIALEVHTRDSALKEISDWDEKLLTLNRMIREIATMTPSSLFRSWPSKQCENIKSQINHMKYDNMEEYVMFLHNAFRLYTSQPRHLTHGIIVDIELAMGLGKVAGLIAFEVKTLEEIRRILEVHKCSKQVLKDKLDVINSPSLLQSRKAYPRNVMFVVVFVSRPKGIIIFGSSFQEICQLGNFSAQNNDMEAKRSFEILKTKAKFLPNVPTPTFDEY